MDPKKIVDADILINKLRMMTGRNWATTYFSGNTYHGDLSAALNMVGQQITMQVNQSINAAMTTMIYELQRAIEESSRDEQGNMCGLCRPHEGGMPVDYRPKV